MSKNLFYKTIKYTHILAAIYNLAFVYSSLHNWRFGFSVVQFVSMPLLLLTGAYFALGKRFNVKNLK